MTCINGRESWNALIFASKLIYVGSDFRFRIFLSRTRNSSVADTIFCMSSSAHSVFENFSTEVLNSA